MLRPSQALVTFVIAFQLCQAATAEEASSGVEALQLSASLACTQARSKFEFDGDGNKQLYLASNDYRDSMSLVELVRSQTDVTSRITYSENRTKQYKDACESTGATFGFATRFTLRRGSRRRLHGGGKSRVVKQLQPLVGTAVIQNYLTLHDLGQGDAAW